MGGAFIQQYYSMIQETLKVSIRKVTLIVTYDILPVSEELSVSDRCPWDPTKKSKNQSDKIVCVRTVAFFTDASAMDKVLSGLGSTDLDDAPPAGSGSAPAPTPSKDPSPRPPGVRK